MTDWVSGGMTDWVSFITYTKGSMQYVTSPDLETQFLNWLNSVGDSSGYTRETTTKVGVRCSPTEVHVVAKKEAIILSLVGKSE